MYCKNCGSQNTDGVKFCRVCGAPMEQTAAPAAPVNSYAPNPAYKPANPAAGKADSSKTFVLISIIASAIALISIFMDWVGNKWLSLSLWDYIDTQLDLIDYLTTDGYLILIAGFLCVAMAIASVVMHALKKPKAKIISFLGLGAAILWMIFFNSNTSGNSVKVGYYLYIIGVAVAGVCPIIAKKQGK